MQRQEKQIAAAQLARELREGSAVFTFDYRGLTVDEVNDVRRRVRESGGVYRVVKNSTARWALKDVGISGLDEHLSGMTGFAWSPEDPISLAKALHESAKEYEAFRFKAGVVSDAPIGPDEFERFAALPGQDALRAMVVGTIAVPLRNLMNVLEGVPRKLVLVLKAAEQQRAAGGEDA